MANVGSLEEYLHELLWNLYDAEKQLRKALPTLSRRATADELKAALDEHLGQTERHVARLEEAFDQLELPARVATSEGMKHLIAEQERLVADAHGDAGRDAVLIAAVQRIEHYEIASYGTAYTWAALLGHHQVASRLNETLEEEKDADETLTQIAESFVNQQAAGQAGRRTARAADRTTGG